MWINEQRENAATKPSALPKPNRQTILRTRHQIDEISQGPCMPPKFER
jgi:hypothetical protein